MLREARKIHLGRVAVTLLDGGSFMLDGGAMFGLIPKAVWSRDVACDDKNRIRIGCNCLLVEWAGETVRRAIIETGCGAKFTEKEQKIFAVDPQQWLGAALAAAEVDPATITDVVLTHLHFDHAGGLTHEADGAAALTFPNAKVHVQRREFDDARANFGIMTQSYREENFTPIDATDAWTLLDGDGEILPGVTPLLLPGHTRGHQGIVIDGGDRSLIISGDVLPTRHHVRPTYNTAYDLFPVENRESKRRLFEHAADRDALLVIDHEPETPVVTVERDGGYYVCEPTEV